MAEMFGFRIIRQYEQGIEGYSHDHLLQVDQGLASGDATRTAR